MATDKKRLAIFASGQGSNAVNIHKYFSDDPRVEISILVYNRIHAGAAVKMRELNVPCLYINSQNLKEPELLISILNEEQIDLIVLAGFLALLPPELITAFENKIINIHPSLLPKYGGKGMYGNKVHEMVLRNNETESGVSIHYVNEKYDEGELIAQEKVVIEEAESTSSLAVKIHELEYRLFPETIEKLLFG